MNRWIRLIAAVVAMVMIGNLQYAWTLFVEPMMSAHGWKLSEVQWGFTVFIAVMTWTMPLSGWLIDRLGPRLFMTMAGVLCGVGWASLGYARSLPEFYAIYAVAGLGNAFVYCCSTALGLKWFPDKRGVASGLIAAGYGSGAAFFNPLFAYLIRTTDYRTTFLYTGIVLGVLILIAGQFLKYPPMGFVPAPPPGVQPKIRRHSEQFNSVEMLRTPQFYMLFVMMLTIGIGGLMATAQVAPVAHNFQVGATALAIAMSLNPLANGASRFLWGWVSDSLGREYTMAIAFSLQAVFLTSVVTLGRQGDAWFVVTMVLVFLTWGELYVLFPATLADIFGARHAASNYSFLYVTKGLASILAGGLAAQLFERTGTWNYAFYGSGALALCSAMAALGLRRMPLPKKGPATLAILAAIFACMPLSAHEIITTKITWSREVSRIVYARCLNCHREGGPAFSLATYAEARPWAKAIQEEVLRRRMPPWNAVKGFGQFQDDRGLTQEELSLIAEWVDGGAPEGNPLYLPDRPRSIDSPTPDSGRPIAFSGSTVLGRRVEALGIRVTGVPASGTLQVIAVRPDSSIEPLVWVRQSNSADPGVYWFRQPLTLPAGTKLQATPADGAAALLVR